VNKVRKKFYNGISKVQGKRGVRPRLRGKKKRVTHLEVLPENRLFIWRKGVDEAREILKLVDA